MAIFFLLFSGQFAVVIYNSIPFFSFPYRHVSAGLLDSLTSTAESKDCPGVCVHTLATIICYEVLEDIPCPQENQKCCVEKNAANGTSAADAPTPPSTTHRPMPTTSPKPTPKPTQKVEKMPAKTDATKNGKDPNATKRLDGRQFA